MTGLGKKAKNPVKATQRTFEIIHVLQEEDGARLTKLAEKLDMHKSSVHNYLRTLQELDYVVQEGDEYRVGLRFLTMGSFARSRYPVYDVAKRQVRDLADQTGELANLLVEEHGRGVYLYRIRGEEAVRVDSFTGSRVHLHNTALGKAILAFLPEERVDEIITHHGLPSTTDSTVTSRKELMEELESVRERGVAFDRQERLQGLNCVARPIISNSDEVAGAISVSGPVSRMKGTRLEEEIPNKLEEATNIAGLNITYG
ncbi:IclR family transcriptional regulator [Haloferax sp. YSSS75]|uniref:IclR family transcriptional regulator n=1 Tax=Haloferax sp. YSSS75 TaxID=3388564 RepID=UPI00398CCA40